MTWRVAGALLRLLLVSMCYLYAFSLQRGFYLQLLVAVRGDYRLTISVRSLLLLQAKCAECYVDFENSDPQYGLCCDEHPSCQSTSCDIRLNFCIFTSTPSSQWSPQGCAAISQGGGLEAGEVFRPSGLIALYAPVRVRWLEA